MGKVSVGFGLFVLGAVLIWAGVSGKMGVLAAAVFAPTQLRPAPSDGSPCA